MTGPLTPALLTRIWTSPTASAGGLEGPLHVVEPGDVDPLDMDRLEVLDGVEGRRVPVPDHDPASIGREAPRDAQPDAPGSARDDRGLAGNAWFHVISPSQRARLWNDEPVLYGPRRFSGARPGRGRRGLPLRAGEGSPWATFM